MSARSLACCMQQCCSGLEAEGFPLYADDKLQNGDDDSNAIQDARQCNGCRRPEQSPKGDEILISEWLSSGETTEESLLESMPNDEGFDSGLAHWRGPQMYPPKPYSTVRGSIVYRPFDRIYNRPTTPAGAEHDDVPGTMMGPHCCLSCGETQQEVHKQPQSDSAAKAPSMTSPTRLIFTNQSHLQMNDSLAPEQRGEPGRMGSCRMRDEVCNHSNHEGPLVTPSTPESQNRVLGEDHALTGSTDTFCSWEQQSQYCWSSPDDGTFGYGERPFWLDM